MEEMERAGGAVGVGVCGGQAAPGEGVELARLQQQHQSLAEMMPMTVSSRRQQTASMLCWGEVTVQEDFICNHYLAGLRFVITTIEITYVGCL